MEEYWEADDAGLYEAWVRDFMETLVRAPRHHACPAPGRVTLPASDHDEGGFGRLF
jgi:hypothetical protein